jgi:protein O-mannosyl-transferase
LSDVSLTVQSPPGEDCDAAVRRDLYCFSNLTFILLALLLIFALYVKAFSFPFVLDDNMQIVGNRHIMYSGYLGTYFTQDVWSHMPGRHLDGYYRPLLLLWFRLNYLLFKDNSSWWHISTVMVHGVCIVLVYLLGLRFLPDRMTAFLAAAIFGVHPVQVGAAAWVSGVNASLCAVGVLFSFLGYLQFKQNGRYLWLAASLASFALALLTKESALPLALVILAYEWSLGTRRYRFVAAYFLVLALYWIVRAHVLSGLLPRETGRSLISVLLSLPWLLFLYLRMLFLPDRLAVFYDFDYLQHPGDVRFWLPALLLAVAIALVVKHRKAVFLSAWFLLFLAPAFAYAYASMSGEAYNDRQLYLPTVAFSIALAAAARSLPAKKVLSAFLLLLVPLTWMQIRYWGNSRLLFEHTYQVSPASYLAATAYMDQLIPEHEWGKALEVGHDALTHHPEEPILLEEVAKVEFFSGQYASAAAHYQDVAASFTSHPDVWFRLGFSYLYLGRNADAVNALRRAVQLDDRQAAYHYELGIALANLGQQADAIAEVGRAVDLAGGLAGDSQVGGAYSRQLERMKTSIAPDHAGAQVQRVSLTPLPPSR